MAIYAFSTVFRPRLSTNRIKITTASTRKAAGYPEIAPVFRPLKVRIMRTREKIPSIWPAIVIG